MTFLWGTVACEKEDFLIFTATTNDTLSIQNEVQPVYLISQETSANIAERLVWNAPDFEAPTTTTYVVEVSSSSDFSEISLNSGDITSTNYGIRVSNLLDIAEDLELDNDPTTTNTDGDPNNTGMVYARVKAFAGSSSQGANQTILTSTAVTLNIEVIEVVITNDDCGRVYPSTFGLVGSAVNEWGSSSRGYATGNDVPLVTNDGSILMANLHMTAGDFKIRQNNEWTLDYGIAGASAFKNGNQTTYDLETGGGNITVTEGNYNVEFDLDNLTLEVTSIDPVWGMVGPATLNSWDGPDLKLVEDPCNEGIYIASSVVLNTGVMKFRQNDDWNVNMGLGEGGEGTLMIGGFENDIPVTAGTYDVTLDTNNMTYTLTSAYLGGSCIPTEISTFGIVGDAVNSWGGDNRGFAAGNDVPFVTNGADGVFRTVAHMVDGEFKIRQNNEWTLDYGIAGASAFKNGNQTTYELETGGGNISVTEGNYDIVFNENDLTLEVTPAPAVWGIVGDATLNGWGDAPDVKLIPDPCNEGVFKVFGVTLTDGEMKFRANDAWDTDYGLAEASPFKNGNMADYSIEQGGGNFSVTAGTYDITLDTVNLSCTIARQD